MGAKTDGHNPQPAHHLTVSIELQKCRRLDRVDLSFPVMITVVRIYTSPYFSRL